MFRIRDILRRVRILGSGHSITDPDPASDPDPALFVSGFQETNKKKNFVFCSGLLLTEVTVSKFTSIFKDSKSVRSHKKS